MYLNGPMLGSGHGKHKEAQGLDGKGHPPQEAPNRARKGLARKRSFKMQKFDTLTGVAAPLNIVNVDTDMIIPKQFLKTIKRTGLGKSLFYEMRYTQDGKEIP